jgi:hypothetical protein
MISRNTLYSQLKELLPMLLIVYSLPFLILLGVVIVRLQYKIPFSDFMRDPSSTMGAPFYIGFISNLGILFWSFSTAICFFCFEILRKDRNNKELMSFLFFSGVLTSILMLDDLFLFHEYVYPVYFQISEKLVFTGYGIIIILYLARFRKIILETDFLLLVFAFVFFGLSIILDSELIHCRGQYLFEDGFKLFGIVSWFAYFTRINMMWVKYDPANR